MCREADRLEPQLFDEYEVQRGLRDKNGNGVVTGLTNISRIDSFQMVNGVKTPCEGKLWYRGYDCIELVKGFRGDHCGFEEVAYLLLFGELPTRKQMKEFMDILAANRTLPTNFTRDVIMKAPSSDIMNSLTRSVLTLASYDRNCSDTSIENVLRQCIGLISVFPMLSVYGYHAYNHYQNDESMYIHRPSKRLSTAENLLMMLRPDKKYTALEAEVLDIALTLHMEHGGGNNSTFTTRVVTSSGADTYSVIAAALSSLKGPKHGGANIKVVEMMQDLRKEVSDLEDEDEVRAYLNRILAKEAFDKKGLIYGMGHAVYSLSDPRAQVFKGFVRKLAEAKGREKDFALYSMIERLAPEIIAAKARIYKGVSANVDFYSGFVYSMLEIPLEMYTPIFAIARIVGWSAHRIEELINMDKIIRPAYKSVMAKREYQEMDGRI
ncbi:MAG: citrate/2-methylcitrate synthase [Roseburia sp.]|nr:citrate/2-methylcitrate synthase [Roseburia sp.]MCM1098816.1 citrate/2-methylcitrate synthase [Ruminococcus flavefaciens]